MRPAAVYDIETQDWTTFVVGAIYHASGRTVIYDASHETDMVRDLLAIEGEVYAHNGGRFDHLWLLDHTSAPARLKISASGILSLEFEGSQASFRDSLRLFPFSLRTLTDGAKRTLADLCTCGKECGGYCRIRLDMPQSVRARVLEYLEADVKELFYALEYFGARATEWRVDVAATVGGSAWKTARRELGLDQYAYHWDRSTWSAVRAGYYGGRCEVFRTEAKGGWGADVNQMYPWALTRELPVRLLRGASGPAAARVWESGAPGIFRATVHAPKIWVPILPLRCRSGLAFPHDSEFTGDWARPELQLALAHGYELVRVHSAVQFGGLAVIFTPLVERVFSLRSRFGKATREGTWLKLLVNSLTGKFGSKCETSEIVVRPDVASLRGEWTPLDKIGRVWERQLGWRHEPCSHPEWAAYLTAYARISLWQQLVGGETAEDAIYSDTDSCYSLSRRMGLGPGLGQWADEGPIRNFEAYGPKAYRMETLTGEKIRLKGVPRPIWDAVVAGTPQPVEGFAGLRRAGRGDFFVRTHGARRVTRNTGRRLPSKTRGDSRTYPPRVSDLTF